MSYSSKGTVVITGGSSGIGAGFAMEFAKQGYDLFLIAKNKQLMDDFIAHLQSLFSVKISSMIADLGKHHEIKKVEDAIAHIDDIQVLINCAGYGINKDFLDENIQNREHMVTVHDIATIRLCYCALKIMKKNRQGSIINVSSLASLLAIGNNPIYAASKIFINSFSQNLYRNYKKYGIYIQSLCPGFTDTNFAKSGGFKFIGTPMSVESVVKASLAAKKKQQWICIPGRKNKAILILYRLLPRSRSHKIFQRLTH